MGAGGTTSDVSDDFVKKYEASLKLATFHLTEQPIRLGLKDRNKFGNYRNLITKGFIASEKEI